MPPRRVFPSTELAARRGSERGLGRGRGRGHDLAANEQRELCAVAGAPRVSCGSGRGLSAQGLPAQSLPVRGAGRGARGAGRGARGANQEAAQAPYGFAGVERYAQR
jgi:hypothetical protein